jgi:hypothetical protein
MLIDVLEENVMFKDGEVVPATKKFHMKIKRE